MGFLPVQLVRLLLLLAHWLRLGLRRKPTDTLPQPSWLTPFHAGLLPTQSSRRTNVGTFRLRHTLASLLLAAGYLALAPPAALAQSPGGVSSNLRLWLKGNTGFTPSSWADQSGNSFNYTQTNATRRPSAVAAAAKFNFNPAVDFSGGKFMNYTGAVLPNSSNASIYVVVNLTTVAGNQDFLGFGASNTTSLLLNANSPVIGQQAGKVYFFDGNWPIASIGPVVNKNGIASNRYTHNTAGSLIQGFNGLTETETIIPGSTVSGAGSTLGSQPETTDGYILEAIVYNSNLSAADHAKIESYLALKYGITLPNNYVSAGGTTVYTASSYNANITGIGRDDNTSLDQRQSRSVNDAGFVTLGNGTGIAATNAANTNAFSADASYEIIGDNGAPTSYSTAYAPTTFTPTVPSAFKRMGRTWKVQETGTVGIVTISVPASSNAERLLVSNDGSFTPGNTQEIALTPDGNGNLTAQVDFADGAFFSFGAVVIAPGCVASDLLVWYKPDVGLAVSGSAVTDWTDQHSGITVSQATAGNRPTLQPASSLFNFNPALQFDGSNDHLDMTTRFISSTAPGSMFAAALANVNGGYENLADLGVDNPHMGLLGNDQIMWLNGSGGPFPAVGGPIKDGQMQVWDYYWNSGAPGQGQRLDGVAYDFPTSTSSSVVGNEGANFRWSIGGYGAVENWTGNIAEVILYERNLSSVEKDRVDTYLSIKYGTTLKHNYLAGDGTTIYNVSSYSANITGIGRDDCQALNQKQSKSVNANGLVTLGNGTGIAATNAANTNTFSADKSFEVIGDNGQPSQYATTYASSFTAPTTVYSMSRIWKVQETGTVGPVTVSIPGSGSATYLLVRNDATFTTNAGTTEIQLLPDGNGNLTAQVDFANGQFFTFATPLFSPGCVAANLLTWYKPDAGLALSGSAVTGWTDQQSGITVAQATAANRPTLQPASALFNFNPALQFDGGNDHLDMNTRFISNTAPGTLFAAALANVNAGYENLADLGIDNPHMGLLGNDQIMWLNGSGGPFPAVGGPVKDDQMQVWDYYWNSGAPGQGQRLDGVAYDFPTSTSSSAVGNDGANFRWSIGGYGAVENWTGNIAEVILYDRNLTNAEKDRVDTYLAVKYGVTLRHNYVSGNGTTIYDVSSFTANITGVGRDDCQQLNQKQSKSVNAGSRLTIGSGNTITTTNANHPDSFTSNNAYTVFGDNGATGTTSFSSVTGVCAPPKASADKFSNLAYKVTETGDAPSHKLDMNVSGFGYNPLYPVYMQVATDAAFSNVIANVPMSTSGSVATTNFNFPANSTHYVRFAGNTSAPANICEAPKKQTFHWNGWWYGTKQRVLLPNFIPQSQSATAAMTMSVTVTDANNLLLYRPNVDWWPVFDGLGLFIPRNDNAATENQLITTRMQFRAGTSTSVVAAQTVDFIIRDIDGYIRGRDIVKVYGKVGSSIITPQLSRYKPLPFDALQVNYQGDPQQAIGSNIPWDLGAWGNVYVSFTDPVEEVFVEYRKDNTFPFKVYNDIRIGAVSVTCRPPTPKEPLADNVYVYKEVSPNPVKQGDEATYKFTVDNTNCAAKTISFNDVLPSGLVWKDSSFVTSETITVGSVNSYGNGQTLTTTMTVPPGTSFFYASVTGLTGVRNNQGTYTVQGGTGTTYSTDDPTTTGSTAQPTALTIIANDPLANLTITKTASVATSPQNGTVAYTFTINNPNASAVQAVIQDNLPTSATYVGGTLTGAGSATVNAYAGESTLTIRGYNAAPGTSVVSIVANVSSSTVGSVLGNIAEITPDINSGYQQIRAISNTANTTIIAPPTVAITGPLNVSTTTTPTIAGTATPGAAVTVTGASGELCSTTANASGNWSCSVTVPAGPQTVTAIASNAAGTSTPATASFTATNATLPLTASNPPAQTATAGGTTTGNAAADLVPQGGTAPYNYSNDTGNASCTVVPGATQLPAANLTVSPSGAYSVTAPATPGTYYYCIKVCDSSTPTPQCVTKSYTLTVSPAAGTGTLDCSTAQIMGIVAGTPGNGTLKLTIAISTTGTLPVTVSGSGMAAAPNPYVINATTTGTQTFYIPITYSGAAFGPTTITVTGAGTCSPDLSTVTPKTVSTQVLNLGPACLPASAATLVK